ncbi:unnamed protein product, partial [Sphacelaria rigidula]
RARTLDRGQPGSGAAVTAATAAATRRQRSRRSYPDSPVAWGPQFTPTSSTTGGRSRRRDLDPLDVKSHRLNLESTISSSSITPGTTTPYRDPPVSPASSVSATPRRSSFPAAAPARPSSTIHRTRGVSGKHGLPPPGGRRVTQGRDEGRSSNRPQQPSSEKKPKNKGRSHVRRATIEYGGSRRRVG